MTRNDILQVLPNDNTVERAVIGILITYPNSLSVVTDQLEEDDFHDTRLAYIYSSLLNNNINNDTPFEVVISTLSKDPKIEKDFIYGLAGDVGTQAGLQFFIDRLRELSQRRKLIKLLTNVVQNAYDENIDLSEISYDVRIAFEYLPNTNQQSLTQRIKDWIDNSPSEISKTTCDNELNLKGSEKINSSQIFKRLIDEGKIERISRGWYRKIEDVEFEDWINADTKPINISLPFGMHKYVELYPGDIFVYAGSKSTGKSALAFETIRLNMSKFKTYYHSSELKKQSFKKRISLCEETPLERWKSVKFSSGLNYLNAPDRVQPDDFNCFDYLEVNEGEFFKMGSVISKIHRKLKDGIALICLQKNKGSEFARGGEATKDKPNLYCLLDEDRPGCKLTISECKAFKGDINPRGFSVGYKIVKGINLKPKGILSPDGQISWRE